MIIAKRALNINFAACARAMLNQQKIINLNILNVKSLLMTNQFHFAFMALFQQNKKPHELSPIFKRNTKPKGYSKHKKNNGIVSPKLNSKIKLQKFKIKNSKTMLKRVKIVGPSWNRQFKFKSPGAYHLKRNKSRNNLMRKKKARYISAADKYRVQRLIPYFKRKSLKMRY